MMPPHSPDVLLETALPTIHSGMRLKVGSVFDAVTLYEDPWEKFLSRLINKLPCFPLTTGLGMSSDIMSHITHQISLWTACQKVKV